MAWNTQYQFAPPPSPGFYPRPRKQRRSLAPVAMAGPQPMAVPRRGLQDNADVQPIRFDYGLDTPQRWMDRSVPPLGLSRQSMPATSGYPALPVMQRADIPMASETSGMAVQRRAGLAASGLPATVDVPEQFYPSQEAFYESGLNRLTRNQNSGVAGGYAQAGVNPAFGDRTGLAVQRAPLPQLNQLGAVPDPVWAEMLARQQRDIAKQLLQLEGVGGITKPTTYNEWAEASKQRLAAANEGFIPNEVPAWEGPTGRGIAQQQTSDWLRREAASPGSRFAATEDRPALADVIRGRRLERQAGFQLPLEERRGLLAQKRTGMSKRQREIAMGTRMTPEEQQVAMQERGLRDRAFADAITGLSQVAPPTPELIDSIAGHFYGGRGLSAPGARMDQVAGTSETREEFIERGLREKLGTREELEAEADTRFGKQRTWGEFATGVHESPWYKHNFPALRNLSEWIAGKVLPPEEIPADIPPEMETRLRELASGNGPKAEKARDILRQVEMRRAGRA